MLWIVQGYIFDQIGHPVLVIDIKNLLYFN